MYAKHLTRDSESEQGMGDFTSIKCFFSSLLVIGRRTNGLRRAWDFLAYLH